MADVDPLPAALAENRAALMTATQDASDATLTDMLFRAGLAAGVAHSAMKALDAALAFHERTQLYAPDSECGHDIDAGDWPQHFEDDGEWFCADKPLGAVCSTCTEDGLPVAFPCHEREQILKALTGKKDDGGQQG